MIFLPLWGFHPRGNESNIYSVADSDLCLIGTSEITLGAYHYRQKIAADQLPIRMVGLSHCFRREAGAAGKRDRGLFRVHQFTKAELFIVGQPEDGEAPPSGVARSGARYLYRVGGAVSGARCL